MSQGKASGLLEGNKKNNRKKPNPRAGGKEKGGFCLGDRQLGGVRASEDRPQPSPLIAKDLVFYIFAARARVPLGFCKASQHGNSGPRCASPERSGNAGEAGGPGPGPGERSGRAARDRLPSSGTGTGCRRKTPQKQSTNPSDTLFPSIPLQARGSVSVFCGFRGDL